MALLAPVASSGLIHHHKQPGCVNNELLCTYLGLVINMNVSGSIVNNINEDIGQCYRKLGGTSAIAKKV